MVANRRLAALGARGELPTHTLARAPCGRPPVLATSTQWCLQARVRTIPSEISAHARRASPR
eukprot:15007502-Alexandrium_andersonii.AAC.1